MQGQPYVFVDGRREEELEFYRQVLGAQVTDLARDKILHTCFHVGETTGVESDGPRLGHLPFQGFAVSLVPTDEEAERVFATFAQGGQVQVPLGKTFFSSRFGMVSDGFGVLWMVSVAP